MPNPNKQALIIGIDVYQDSRLGKLDSCRIDAQDMTKALSNLEYTIYGDGPLIGSNLDKENGHTKVIDSITYFFGNAKPSQTLIFYYSGHGIPWSNDVFLSTPQINASLPRGRGFSFADLTDAVANSPSKRIVCIIDSCHAGEIGVKGSPEDNAAFSIAKYDKLSDNLPEAKGINFLLSSQAYQPSQAVKDSNSLYTKFLLEGLKGVLFEKDERGRPKPGTGTVDDYGIITPKYLHDYAYDKVGSLPATQIPRFKSSQSSEIEVAELPNLVKPILNKEETKKMLSDMLTKNKINPLIASKAFEIIALESVLTEKERKYCDLLNQLQSNKIAEWQFSESWKELQQKESQPDIVKEQQKIPVEAIKKIKPIQKVTSQSRSTKKPKPLVEQETIDEIVDDADEKQNDAGALIRKGNTFFDNGEYEKAIAYYKKALDNNPDSVDAKAGINDAQVKLGRRKVPYTPQPQYTPPPQPQYTPPPQPQYTPPPQPQYTPSQPSPPPYTPSPMTEFQPYGTWSLNFKDNLGRQSNMLTITLNPSPIGLAIRGVLPILGNMVQCEGTGGTWTFEPVTRILFLNCLLRTFNDMIQWGEQIQIQGQQNGVYYGITPDGFTCHISRA